MFAGDATLSPVLRRWARFFDHPSDDELDALAAEDEVMADTVNKLREISEDERHFHIAESRKRGEIAQRLGLSYAFAEGREEGREEGRLEIRVETARAMLREGLERSVVARVLGMSESQLDGLLDA